MSEVGENKYVYTYAEAVSKAQALEKAILAEAAKHSSATADGSMGSCG